MTKKQFMAHYYMLDKKLDKIKKIRGIEKSNGTKILTETCDKLPDDITLKNCRDNNCMSCLRRL